MPREKFEHDMKRLQEDVLALGVLAETAVLDSVEALRTQDVKKARAIIAADRPINEKRFALENEALTLIATQQPMARDARFLAAVWEIITELERIGDYAKGICKINLLMSEELVDPAVMLILQQMADLGLDMLRRSLDAFCSQDVSAARAIPHEDDAVDNLYNQVYRLLLDRMILSPSWIDRGNHLMWAAHNLERMADRVSNICERIVYVNTGQLRELESFDDLGVTHE